MDFTSILTNEQIKRKNIEKSARKAALVALLGGSLMFLFQLIYSFAVLSPIMEFFPELLTDTASYFWDMFGYVFYIAIPFAITALIFKKINKNFENKGVKRSTPKAPALYIFGTIGVGYIINLTINILFSDLIEQYSVDMGIVADNVLQVILCYVLYAILPAILEEWAFRGVLCKNLLPYGKGGAIIISSVLFGVAHVDPPRIVFATAFGLMLAVCYEHTRSLKIPVLIHFINNAISVTMSLIPTDSAFTVLLSSAVFGLIGCGIAAIVYYANNGIARKKVSIIKPQTVGYQLSIGKFATKAVLNFGMIPLVILYAIFFVLYYFV